jgi:hypothetical protein
MFRCGQSMFDELARARDELGWNMARRPWLENKHRL